ncbi:MAG: DUF2330 domain-containing protein [Polyangiaceae bacterium]
MPTLCRPFFALLGLAATTALVAPGTADACAILPAERSATPDLAAERVLILHDAERGLEHFVREVRFNGFAGTFAFVVPTPTQPEVAVVEKPPFDDLERAFPVDPPPPLPPPWAKSAGAPPPQAVASVQVLAVRQVGKFTAFVLAASDAAGLEKWLIDNRIEVPAGGKAWLRHYIGLQHFFTAFRYDAPVASPSPAAAEMTSETVPLTFAASTPYFPYLEPEHGAAGGSGFTHQLHVWLVSNQRRAPRLRRFATYHPPRWAWPWNAGMVYERDAGAVGPALGARAPLAPRQGALVVQTFYDRRTNRDGWGDIVFPADRLDLGDPAIAAGFTPILGDLGKLIHHGAPESYDEVESEETMRLPPGSGACGCHLPGAGGGPGSSGPDALAALAASALGRRRRRPR